MSRQRRVAAATAVLAFVVAGCRGHSGSAGTSSTKLNGAFHITAGACPAGSKVPTGSYLVVIAAAANKAVQNTHGTCTNKGYTLLRPGADGGLVTGEFQDISGVTFDSQGDSRADRIIAPTRFDKLRFGFATNPRDEQDAASGAPAFPRPAAIVSGTALRVDLRSLVVSYGGNANTTCATSFGLGCWELGSENATGTYNRTNGRYAINWFAGESFTKKGDSIEVHLAGDVRPAIGVSCRAPMWLASTLAVTVGLGVAVAADRSAGPTAPSAAPVAPLSAADRKALVADSALIESLPAAFAEVPQAAADVSGTNPSSARGALDRVPALAPLAKATDGQAPALTLLVTRYRALVSHGVRPDSASLAQALETLQAIEGDVVPAARVVALDRGRKVSAAAALTAVERDSHAVTLGRLLADWSETYGALVLVEQAAAG